MKAYYIDDTMFQVTPFAREVLTRFFNLARKEGGSTVFISTTHCHDEAIHKFESELQDCVVVKSPALFEVGICRGNLSLNCLSMDEFPVMYAYSGTCIEYDFESKSCKRIYLDLFPKHDSDVEYESFVEELESILKDKIIEMKKKRSIKN